jgi:hypothetical protein
MNEWDDAHWFKADASGDRSKAPHVFTRREWECFLSGARKGEFDLPK